MADSTNHHHLGGASTSGGGGGDDGGGGGWSREQAERLLPIANVGRIMKQILPPNAKVSKEAKETMQECVSEFISFVTSEASEKCRKERRKTVNGDDVCWAMGSLGFDDYASPLRRYLHRYREVEGERSTAGGNNNQGGGGGGGGGRRYEHDDDPAGGGGGGGGPSSFKFDGI
ncbi:unnamed protein product [Linum trigynum]|uniref:Transcription factor CBF/NF-Y/archaeal histone domain-containing protein n=1 Tax=Linum trigynum TaxID=586398 RepID=A0AAV2FGT8_9ROSI